MNSPKMYEPREKFMVYEVVFVVVEVEKDTRCLLVDRRVVLVECYKERV